MVPCQKRGWQQPMNCELGKIMKDRDSYTVLVLNLPYFCGPDWQRISGGKPMALECQSPDEIVELLETIIVNRMQEGILHVEG